MIRILLTDGIHTKQIYFTNHTGSGVYHGTPNEGAHSSYHATGQTHYKGKDGVAQFVQQHVPLSEFCGLKHLETVLKSTQLLDTDLYDPPKTDAVVYLDTRAMPSVIIHFDIGLLETHRLDILHEQWAILGRTGTAKGTDIKQLLVITSVSPWVYITVRWS